MKTTWGRIVLGNPRRTGTTKQTMMTPTSQNQFHTSRSLWDSKERRTKEEIHIFRIKLILIKIGTKSICTQLKTLKLIILENSLSIIRIRMRKLIRRSRFSSKPWTRTNLKIICKGIWMGNSNRSKLNSNIYPSLEKCPGSELNNHATISKLFHMGLAPKRATGIWFQPIDLESLRMSARKL
jgi:hypothetical protein